jgi:hypothetical protein
VDTSLAEKVIEDSESRADAVRLENLQLREILVQHLRQTTEILTDKPEMDEEELREKLSLPLDLAKSNVEVLSARVLSLVRKEREKQKKEHSSENVAIEVHRQNLTRLEAIGNSSNSDQSTVVTELKKMFHDGKELLRLNQGLVEVEKERLEAERRLLEGEMAELKLRKKAFVLSTLEAEENLGAAAAEGQAGGDLTEAGPMWSRQPICEQSCMFTVVGSGGGNRSYVSSPGVNFHVGPLYGGSSSRPPSLPGSRPGSRSHSGARTKSPVAR